MDKDQKNSIIKNSFGLLAGKRIKKNSLVVKYGVPIIYQVIEKDSRVAICKPANNMFETSEYKPETFLRSEICLYYELMAEIEKEINK